MFADLHHLHQFVSLEQGGAVTATSWGGGTNAGEADIYFGAAHINADNVHEKWISDDQASDFNAGVNGPIDRNEVNSFIPIFPDFCTLTSLAYDCHPSFDNRLVG